MEAEVSRPHAALSKHELEAQLVELAGHFNAAEYRWLSLLAEFDCRQSWSDGATYSCAHWLNWQCGIALGAAREKVRVAHALGKLPRVSASMARGELSYSKVRAITRIACPETEEMLLNIALHGTAAHVEKTVRYFRRVQEAQALSREGQQQANRRVSFFYDDDGSLVIKSRLPAETGALFIRALDAALEDAPRNVAPGADVSAQTPVSRPTLSVRRADALAVLAESFLKHGAEAMTGGERHQIVVHVDSQTLRGETAGRCDLEDGPPIAAETARRLACDSSVVPILETLNGDVLNVGRKTRSIPPALRRALKARDQGCCRFPGCTHKRYIDAHHIRHWACGGETKASNLVTLCRFHHRSVHEGQVRIEVLNEGALRFLRPDGRAFDSAPPSAASSPDQGLFALAESHGIRIESRTAATRWRGERMDYGLAIEVLLMRAERSRHAQDVSAET